MQRKKKVDYVALASPFMRIPRMNVRAARALLDMGIKEVYELKGRDPNSLLADYSKIKNDVRIDDFDLFTSYGFKPSDYFGDRVWEKEFRKGLFYKEYLRRFEVFGCRQIIR